MLGFAALGAFASGLVGPLAPYLPVLRKVAGAVVVLLGLHTSELVPLKFLYRQSTIEVSRGPGGLLRPLVVGMTFAFGWTPCVGPILASVLALAATEGGVVHGTELLFVYSLGIGVPFVLTGFVVSGFVRLVRRFGRLVRGLEIAAGVFLMVVGVFIFTDSLTMVAAWLPFFNRFAR